MATSGRNKRYFFTKQFPQHDAKAIDIELHASVSVDMFPVLRRNVSNSATLRSTVCLCCGILSPFGQAKVTDLCQKQFFWFTFALIADYVQKWIRHAYQKHATLSRAHPATAPS